MRDHEDRRRNGGLTDEQFQALKTKLKAELGDELYKEFWDDVAIHVGRGVIAKGLYLLGTALIALAAWLHGSGKITIFGGG
jgi:hypothetical protein